MTTSIVTGGAGFIGSWLCRELLEKGHHVICADNLITGSKKNIDERVEFIHVDVSEDTLDLKANYIFHLASPASPVHYQKHPVETLKVNSIGTLKMLELAEKNHARLLYASSSEVYGEPKEHPQREEYWGNVNSYGPRSCYDEGKRFSEALIRSFPNVDARIARIFNTYGPRMSAEDGRVVPNFISQAIKNKPVTVYGSGSQTRSFCYVSDTVAGLMALMFSDRARGEVVNIGNPNEMTVLELAKLIVELTGSKSKIIYENIPKDDPTRRKPDITKSKTLLHWEPKVDTKYGLMKTIEYFTAKDSPKFI